ncbi:TetR/AcrR family transcriptional regulator [Nocardia sp. CA-084685]|uniref:TetR/AcrR family transcriptional regulator n=1 Tax=Nocardia sp. CA-084685 TaxID=3239970 RepID=UPI003D971FB3
MDTTKRHGRRRPQADGAASPDGKPLTLRERNRLRTRRVLLDAALEVFAESGFGAATVETIAARAGASKVTVYSYFPQGREELFRELYTEVTDELVDHVRKVYDSEGTLADRILAVTKGLLAIAQRPLVGRFYSISDPALDEALRPVQGVASGTIVDLIASDIGRAQQSGEVRTTASPTAVAGLLVGAMRAALADVAYEKMTAADVLEAMAALAEGL